MEHEADFLAEAYGTPRKVMDVSAIRKLGWGPKVDLQEGIERTYRWYLEHGEGK